MRVCVCATHMVGIKGDRVEHGVHVRVRVYGAGGILPECGKLVASWRLSACVGAWRAARAGLIFDSIRAWFSSHSVQFSCFTFEQRLVHCLI